MKKITLDLDDLKVESFETLDSRDGSVFGLDPISCPTCAAPTCALSCSCTGDCGGGPTDGCGSSGGNICK